MLELERRQIAPAKIYLARQVGEQRRSKYRRRRDKQQKYRSDRRIFVGPQQTQPARWAVRVGQCRSLGVGHVLVPDTRIEQRIGDVDEQVHDEDGE